MRRLMILAVIALLLIPSMIFARGNSEPEGPEMVTLTIAGRDGYEADLTSIADHRARRRDNAVPAVIKTSEGINIGPSSVDTIDMVAVHVDGATVTTFIRRGGGQWIQTNQVADATYGAFTWVGVTFNSIVADAFARLVGPFLVLT